MYVYIYIYWSSRLSPLRVLKNEKLIGTLALNIESFVVSLKEYASLNTP